LVDTLTGASGKYVINSHRHCVCHLPSQGYGTTEFDMIEERLEALIAIGHKTMGDFLQGKTADHDKAHKL
jgi:hypothetical protein